MNENHTGGYYYAAGHEVPLLTGDEPKVQRPMTSADFTEAALDGETREQYLTRLSAQAIQREVANEPVRDDLTAVADDAWADKKAREVLAARGIERPTVAQYKAALAASYDLIVRARTS